MGGSVTKQMEPQELAEFKKLPTDTLLNDIDIPERPENRQRTDKNYLIIYGALVILLMPFLIYTLAYSDMDRFLHYYDSCGNVCGKKNSKYDEWSCTGQDYTDKGILKFNEPFWTTNAPGESREDIILTTPRECVSSCPFGYNELASLSMCFPSERTNSYDYSADRYTSYRSKYEDKDLNDVGLEIAVYLRKVAWRITLACFLSLGVTLGTLYLFRRATAAMVWSMIAGFATLLTIGVIGTWILYFNIDQTPSENNSSSVFLFLAVFATVILAVVVCVIIFLAKKVKLVIALLKEAMKAAFAMPQLLLLPILTFVSQAIILAIFFTTIVYMQTSGVLSEYKEGFLAYQKNIVMHFSIFFNFVMTIWSLQLVVGIQYMVIAGAVAKWYFTKDKNYLGRPILTSALNTFKYHLGTVAFGSLVITLIMIVRALITSAIKNRYLKAIVDFCLSGIEQFLKFLSKNAYIMTAMHGKPFYKSGKRAAKIIFQNAVNVVAINFIGDFILALAQLAIVAVSLVLTYAIMQVDEYEPYVFIVYAIVFLISLIIAATFFSIFETVIDTLFLCFCEDTLLNDGMARPYAMSTGLMEFMDNAKKIFGEKKKEGTIVT